MSYKSFVSHSVIDNNQEQVIDKQDNNNEDTATTQQVEYDPRTLYERLQEQKNKKEEEFREATRFSNLVKRIDPDEAAYYKSLSDTQQQLDQDLKLKEKMELEEYRRAVEEARVAGTELTTTTPTTTITTTGAKPVAKPKKGLFGGIVVLKKKKRASDEMVEPEQISPKKNTSSTNKGNTSSSQTKTDSTPRADTSSQNKTNSTPESTKKLPVGITSLLAAYDDSDS
ncbi:N-terminal domain of NEFA-interacting nuclear protein NIP30-domain-containing protein, partial [Chlamydoabsidia padenii]